MDNLLTEVSSWLQAPACKQGSIQRRTKSILSFIKGFIRSNTIDLERITGVRINEIVKVVDTCQTSILYIISNFLKGIHYDAISSAYSFVKDFSPSVLPAGARLYKARESHSNYLYSKEEMFHIPYDKRHLIGNQRFSVSGLPCLYLASSSYVCWEELGRVDFNLCNYCGYSNQKDVLVYDFSLPLEISSLDDIKRICIALACSLAAERDDVFKEEYILPQCLLQSLIIKHRYYPLHQRLFAVKYLSVHILNGNADCFEIDLNDAKWVNRLYNYVFPAASGEAVGYNTLLQNLFIQTDVTTMFKEMLLNPDKLISGDSKDVYLDSQFGLLDAFLDNKMGYKPLRKEATFLTI